MDMDMMMTIIVMDMDMTITIIMMEMVMTRMVGTYIWDNSPRE